MHLTLLLAFLSGLPFLCLVEGTCDEIEDFSSLFVLEDLLLHSQIRIVSPSPSAPGADNRSCFCGERPCATPRYALLGEENSTAGSVSNVTLILAPGTHVLRNGLPIHNSEFVGIVGVGDMPHVSEIQCGKLNASDYERCQLKHVNIQNSSYVYIAGITFHQCQPLVSAVHVQNSSHVVFENCTFRYV